MICHHCLATFHANTRAPKHFYCSRACQDADRVHPETVDNGPARTLEDVGRELGLSKSRVAQIEKIAFAKLRRAMRRDGCY